MKFQEYLHFTFLNLERGVDLGSFRLDIYERSVGFLALRNHLQSVLHIRTLYYIPGNRAKGSEIL